MTLKRLNSITLILAILLASSSVMFNSCTKDHIPKKYQSQYLTLEQYNVNEMTKEDFEVIGKALQRLTIERVDYKYIIKQTCGAEVNISEELYKHIVDGFERTNNLKCSCIKISKEDKE